MGCGASASAAGHNVGGHRVLQDKVDVGISGSPVRRLPRGAPLVIGAPTSCVSLGARVGDGEAPVAHQSAQSPDGEAGLRDMLVGSSAHPWLFYAVATFLPWQQRIGELSRVCPDMHAFLNPSDENGKYWQWHCECLRGEARLHLPSSNMAVRALVEAVGSWRALFKELWPLRGRFAPSTSTRVETELFRVAAFCRMRTPRLPSLTSNQSQPAQSTAVSLPLHQQVALLKQRQPDLSHKEAMKLLVQRASTASDGEDVEEVTDNEAPGLMGKRENLTASVLAVETGSAGSVLTVSPGVGIRSWAFDRVFGEAANQEEVFSSCGMRLAVDLINGLSGALIVYGQTGSGKTYTMFGPPEKSDDGQTAGLVCRVASEVLTGVEARRNAGFEVFLGASFVEVFGNDVTDLLGSNMAANRGAHQRMGHRYVLGGQVEEPVESREALEDLLARGETRKRQASTAMNERSTRAHVLVILRFRQRAPDRDEFVEASLCLVDLGGSERVSKSGANEKVRSAGALNVGDQEVSRCTWQEYYAGRERITEASHINKGLLTLKRCVQALHERQECAKEGRVLPRVPFHDSKLTLLLEPALSGNSRTSVIVCCSPEEQHAEETVQSLRFGEMCRAVEHERSSGKVDVGVAVEAAVARLDAELLAVETTIRKKERWEWRQTTRAHVIDEKNAGATVCHFDEEMELGGQGAVEICADQGNSEKHTVEHTVWGQVLVGAEAENLRREELLRQRRLLVGEV
mmetsp:Transcript_20528/g.44836  ORF Transcript_20528/g.44836 Transcript_20528/m.44836 type:complete len:744 (+) Transcript_20528:56-2287(+)